MEVFDRMPGLRVQGGLFLSSRATTRSYQFCPQKGELPFRDPPFHCPSFGVRPCLPTVRQVPLKSCPHSGYTLSHLTSPRTLSSAFPAVLQPCQQQTEESHGALGGEKAWPYATVTHLAQAQSRPDGLQGLLIPVPWAHPLENSPKQSPLPASLTPQLRVINKNPRKQGPACGMMSQSCSVIYQQPEKRKYC